MIALEKRDDNTQRIAVTKNVIPPQVSDHAQSQPVRTSVENPTTQEWQVVQDGHSSSHDVIEYRSFTFFAPNSQRENPMVNTKRPHDVEIPKRYHMLGERYKAIDGCDAYRLDAFDICIVSDVVIPSKFKTLNFEK